MSATELVCASPSQQRLRRSSVAAALRAASAPSQQHQLRRGRDAQNERDGAGLRSSVAAATASQLRRSSARRTMSGRRDIAAARCARRDATHSDAFEQRFLLRASHPLRETHMIFQKLKLQSMEWRGACTLSMPGPLNESEDQDDADLHAKWGK